MIKVETIIEFTLGKFDELKNINRINPENKEKGRLYVGDTFECTEEMCKYLIGDNDSKAVVVKVIEVIPEKIKEEKPVKKVEKEIKKTTKKTSKLTKK